MTRTSGAGPRVVYVSWMSLSKKVAHDWFIDALIARGIEVEYWDVTSLLMTPRRRKSEPMSYLRLPRSWRELDALIRSTVGPDTIYVVPITYGGRTARLYRLLSRRGCRLAYIEWGHSPIRSGGNRLRRMLENPLHMLRNVEYRIREVVFRKLGLIKPFDIVFVAGTSAKAVPHEAARRVSINLVDYDNYVAAKAAPKRAHPRPYAVFLDTNLPFQFDIRLDGLKNPNPATYFPALTRFFDLVEQRYGVDVVIAAHPTAVVGPDAGADYNPSTYGGRRILQARTAELVRDAEFVIGHNSTSFSYALLDFKPILFVYTAEMLDLYRWTRIVEIHQLAEYIAAPVVNVDLMASAADLPELTVDRERYTQYKYNYLTSPESEGSASPQIFTEEIARELGLSPAI